MYLNRRFQQLIDDNSLPKIRFHDLRHFYATNAHNNGTPIKKLAQALGHSSAAITVEHYVSNNI